MEPEPAPGVGEATSPEATLVATVETLLAEVHPRQQPRPVALDSALEKDLGLDSLARAELLLRLETAFGVALPERLLAEAETPRDLLEAVARAAPGDQATAPGTTRPELVAIGGGRATAAAAESAPESAPTLPAVLAWHA